MKPDFAAEQDRAVEQDQTDEQGMVTAELAVGILVACLISLALAWCISVLGTQIKCSDSAAAIARQYARNDQDNVQAALDNAPAGAIVEVARDGQLVAVTVEVERSISGFSMKVTGAAKVLAEPAVFQE